MSFFNIQTVRGEHIAQKTDFDLDIAPAIAVQDLHYEGQLRTVNLRSVLGEGLYVLKGDKGVSYINAQTGDDWEPLGETSITLAARRYYTAQADIAHVIKLDKAPIEYRGTVPIWQVEFDDKDKTRLYLDPQTAELRSVRTRLWRVFDFMWGLHIMDYGGRDNTNHWWLKLLSFLAFLFALTGIGLVAQRLSRGRGF